MICTSNPLTIQRNADGTFWLSHSLGQFPGPMTLAGVEELMREWQEDQDGCLERRAGVVRWYPPPAGAAAETQQVAVNLEDMGL